jgi:tetrapyrrole methylase family protein/MazG family protein
MGILRAPGGCPWDREQTHLSIRNNAVEEAYEVVDAIDLGDTELLQEELGDLLLQAVFHSVIAEKEEEFNLNDVISGLCAKLIFRHKHVFGTVTAKNGAEALLTWENAKLEKKSYATVTEELLAVPKSFPQALRAVKLQKKAGKANYGILNPDGALARLREELEEFAVGGGGERAELSAGECLFSLVNVLRLAGIDPEVALNRASDGFIREFAAVERLADKRGLELHGMTCDAVGRLCREAKPEE